MVFCFCDREAYSAQFAHAPRSLFLYSLDAARADTAALISFNLLRVAALVLPHRTLLLLCRYTGARVHLPALTAYLRILLRPGDEAATLMIVILIALRVPQHARLFRLIELLFDQFELLLLLLPFGLQISLFLA